MTSTESKPDPITLLQHAVRRLARQTAGRALTGLSHEDADESVGTVATDDAIGFDPIPVLRAMYESGARVMVIGQVAGIMHGSRDLTGDLDLLWDGDPTQAHALVAAFTALSAALFDDEGRALTCDLAAVSRPKVLFRTATASGDCCTPALPWGKLPIVQFLDRCRVARAPDGFQIRYVDRQDLILMRQAAGREKDRRRAKQLLGGNL